MESLEPRDQHLKKLSLIKKSEYKEILVLSEYMLKLFKIQGGVKLCLNSDGVRVSHCMIHAGINGNNVIPIIITSTLEELRNRLVNFQIISSECDISGISDLGLFIDYIQEYKTKDVAVSGNLKILEIDMVAFFETIEDMKHKRFDKFISADKDTRQTIH